MGKTNDGREKLRQLLLQHGSFEKVEGALERWHEQKKQTKEAGGYVTKERLMKERHYTRSMADHAFEWARPLGLVRVSKIHGAEEADIPLDFEWSKTRESGSRIGFSSSFSMAEPLLHLHVSRACYLCFILGSLFPTWNS
ncbi:OGG1 [Symbiodinium pilosum]|uniref:OGG1 protein n=1 Tax=Symbiodinium pilosum TaxID=2952 RepID=A0A812W9S2_SYMPI|nr:OGG1 [Symbiodinium pilosum]